MARHFVVLWMPKEGGGAWKNWTAKSVSRIHDPLEKIPDLIMSSFITELFTLHQKQRTHAYNRLRLNVAIDFIPLRADNFDRKELANDKKKVFTNSIEMS